MSTKVTILSQNAWSQRVRIKPDGKPPVELNVIKTS